MPDDATAHCSKLVAFHRGPVADAPRHLTSSMNSIFIRDLRIHTGNRELVHLQRHLLYIERRRE